jgi:hypothetical protein
VLQHSRAHGTFTLCAEVISGLLVSRPAVCGWFSAERVDG